MSKLSIIIVTYNSSKHIFDCLESIFQYNDINDGLEVIVVDNHSEHKEEMFAKIRDLYCDKVILVDSGKNGGYGYGNNVGVKIADADIVIIMNPDVRFVAPVFKGILKVFKDPNLGMAGVDFIDGSSPYYFKPEHSTFCHAIMIHAYLRIRRYDPEKMYMSGSLLIFNRKSFIEAGMFDENIFMYYEEPDITNRILKLGKDVKWLKDTKVQHLAHGRKFNQKLTDVGYASFEYYCKKYGLNAKKHYQRYVRTLKIKIFAAKIIGAKEHLELFQKTLDSLENHIKKMEAV